MNGGGRSQDGPKAKAQKSSFHILDAKRRSFPLPMGPVVFFLFSPSLITSFTQPEALRPILARPGRGPGCWLVVVEPWPCWNAEPFQDVGRRSYLPLHQGWTFVRATAGGLSWGCQGKLAVLYCISTSPGPRVASKLDFWTLFNKYTASLLVWKELLRENMLFVYSISWVLSPFSADKIFSLSYWLWDSNVTDRSHWKFPPTFLFCPSATRPAHGNQVEIVPSAWSLMHRPADPLRLGAEAQSHGWTTATVWCEWKTKVGFANQGLDADYYTAEPRKSSLTQRQSRILV